MSQSSDRAGRECAVSRALRPGAACAPRGNVGKFCSYLRVAGYPDATGRGTPGTGYRPFRAGQSLDP